MFKNLHSKTLIRILALMENRLWRFIFSVLLFSAVLAYCFNLVTAFVFKNVIDASISGDQSFLTRAIILALSTSTLGALMLMLSKVSAARSIWRTMKHLQEELFSRLVNLPVDEYEQRHSGDIISRTTNDLQQVEYTYWHRLQPLSMAIILGMSATLYVIIANWRMGILAITLGICTVSVSFAFAKPIRATTDQVQKQTGKLTERLTDLLQSLPVTKIFQLEDKIHHQFVLANQEVSATMLKNAKLTAAEQAVRSLLGSLESLGAISFGLFLMVNGYIELSVLVASAHLMGNASFLFGNLGAFQTVIQRSISGGNRVFELLDQPDEPESYPSSSQNSSTKPDIADNMVAIDRLNFSYNGSNGQTEIQVLENLNLFVKRGSLAALVGPSGGGKSTIIKLLLGLYPVKDGEIYIQGKSIDEYPLEKLRGLMAYVPQDAYLFDGSIKENIAYGRPDAADEEIFQAAKQANAHEFILEQPEGYDTKVGERGTRLSGGQRQRIAIARALLKDAPILLLDEATSALDSESEQQVQDALNQLMKGRTTIAVAHRLSTVEKADTIFVVDHGQVVECGSHQELLVVDGLYKTLYQI